jgi:hypothetical protein
VRTTSEPPAHIVIHSSRIRILKSVNVQTSLTSCAFTTEGAAIYLGTGNGKLMTLDLRALEKEPKSVIIGDGDSPIKAINVQVRFRFAHVLWKAPNRLFLGYRKSPNPTPRTRKSSQLWRRPRKCPQSFWSHGHPRESRVSVPRPLALVLRQDPSALG